MVLGDVDRGIWPENTSFADHVDGIGVPTFSGGTLVYGPPPATFTGGCVAGGGGFNPATCNNKLIGAKYYNANLLAGRAPTTGPASIRRAMTVATSWRSRRPHRIHRGRQQPVPAVVNGVPLARHRAWRRARASRRTRSAGAMSPPPPTAPAAGTAATSDSVEAIDDAVKDGVNVINFSISGSTDTINDPVEQAFYRATLAGVFVAASAGNDGPANTVNHLSPWLTTVAASTHDRVLEAAMCTWATAPSTPARR